MYSIEHLIAMEYEDHYAEQQNAEGEPISHLHADATPIHEMSEHLDIAEDFAPWLD